MTSMTEIELEVDGEAPTGLYRFYAADGALLYVGISNNVKARFAQHAADKSWWPEVARKTVAWHSSRATATAAESAAIKGEHPLYNIAGTGKPPRRRGPLATPAEPASTCSAWPDDVPPTSWPQDFWCREWWNHISGEQYEELEMCCPKWSAMEAMGNWHYERRMSREGRGGTPIFWRQDDFRLPPVENPYTEIDYSIHADITCAVPWPHFTPEIALVQERFLHALLDAGYCRRISPGPAAAAFGFRAQLHAQIAGTVLGDLAKSHYVDVAVRCTEALQREIARKAAWAEHAISDGPGTSAPNTP